MRNLVTIAVAAALSCAAWSVAACSCEEDDRPRDQQVASYFAASDIVAVLRVVGTERAVVQIGTERKSGRWLVLEAQYIFKGPIALGHRFYVPAPRRMSRSSCEASFEKRELLLVYARENSPLELGACSASGSLPIGDLPLLFELAKGRT